MSPIVPQKSKKIRANPKNLRHLRAKNPTPPATPQFHAQVDNLSIKKIDKLTNELDKLPNELDKLPTFFQKLT